MAIHDPYGRFADDGESFIITTPRTPRPWFNHLWNNRYLATVSQVGQGVGLAQDAAGVRTELVTGRMLHLVDADTGALWNANALECPVDAFACHVSPGRTRIESRRDGVAVSWSLGVPVADACELWLVRVRNTGDRPRRLRIVPCVETAIEGQHEGTVPAARAAWDPTLGVVRGSNVVRFGSWYSHETVGATADGFVGISGPVAGHDARRSAFIGHYGSRARPEALVDGGRCTGSVCDYENIVFALQRDTELAPGAEVAFALLAGTEREDAAVAALCERYLDVDRAEAALAAARAAATARCRRAEIETPDPAFDRFFNLWLQHQLAFNRTWARVYFNGFRDLLQDAGNSVALDAADAADRVRRVLRHQYANGYAPRAWCQGELIDQRYADSPVWIARAVAAVVAETGDPGFLAEEIPFWEEDASGSVYEHLRRALEHLWGDRGPHGLSRMHEGDWNDVMNGVGKEGRGESVWLSMALVDALDRQVELAGSIGADADAERARARAAELRAALDRHAWDGAWYLRAITDAGRPLGTAADAEARCFLNPQTWAVIAGIGDAERRAACLRAVDERLELPYGGVTTIDAPFTGFRPDVGFVSAIRPGENVNAGVYVHANMFKAVADCLAGRPDAAWRTVAGLLPHADVGRPPTGEPYSLPNSYMGPGSAYREGSAGSGWITGSAGWLVTLVLRHFLGLEATPAGLRVAPRLPAAWPRCAALRRFRGATYSLTYARGPVAATALTVDGEPLTGDLLPLAPAGATVAVTVTVPEAADG